MSCVTSTDEQGMVNIFFEPRDSYRRLSLARQHSLQPLSLTPCLSIRPLLNVESCFALPSSASCLLPFSIALSTASTAKGQNVERCFAHFSQCTFVFGVRGQASEAKETRRVEEVELRLFRRTITSGGLLALSPSLPSPHLLPSPPP